MLRLCAPSSRALRTLCGAAQSENFYQLLGLRESFSLNPADLSARFKRLQATWHPDKFANHSISDQQAAADMSARLNVAHDVLNAPHRRARHLLSLRDPSIILDHVPPAPNFLAWVMTFRESVENAATNPAHLARLRDELFQHREKTMVLLSNAFENGDLDTAALATAKLQYFHSIHSVIDDFPLE